MEQGTEKSYDLLKRSTKSTPDCEHIINATQNKVWHVVKKANISIVDGIR